VSEQQETLPVRVGDILTELAAIDCDTPPQQVAAVVQRIDAIKDLVRELDRMKGEVLAEWLDDGRSLEIGAKRYYLGKTVVKQARDNAKALDALFAAAAGDFERVAGCMSKSASAWKYATAKQLLGDAYDDHFIETVKTNVKGETIKTVKAVDTRFQR
jgi:hypothetical protein